MSSGRSNSGVPTNGAGGKHGLLDRGAAVHVDTRRGRAGGLGCGVLGLGVGRLVAALSGAPVGCCPWPGVRP